VPEWLSAAVDADGPSRTSQIHLYPVANHANSIMAARRARRGDRPCRTDGSRGARNQGLSPRGTGVRIQFPPADSPSLSGLRIRSKGKAPGFQPLCGPFRAAVVGRDHRRTGCRL